MDLADIIAKLDNLSISASLVSESETETNNIENDLENVINSISKLNINDKTKTEIFSKIDIILYKIYWKKNQCGIEEKNVHNPNWVQ
jgi:hypothetical protein